MYSDAKSARRPLYDIQGSSVKVAHAQQPSPQSPGAPPPQAPAVNGRNVTEVAFGRGNQRFGTYTQTGNRQWLEVPAARGNPRHNFAETNRDDWSVYLSDRSRNVHLQLNLHTKKVMYSDARSSRRPLYDIQGTSAKAVQAPPPRSTPNQVTRRPPATTERDYPGGFVEIRHEGGYVAQFTVKYEIAQGSSGWRRETWKSGKKTLGYKVTYNFPTGSRNISIKGSNDTGLIEPFGAPHKTVLSKSFKLAPNKCYKVYGTTLHPGNGTCKPDVINTMTRAVENASRTYRREIEAVANHLRTITRTPNIESIAKSAHDRRDFTELARLLQLDTLTAALQGGQRGDLGGNGFALKGDGSAKVRELPPWRIGRAPLQARHGPRLLHLSAFQPEANGMVSSPSGNRLNLAAGGNTFNAISWAIAVADVSVLFGATGELGVIFPNGGSESPAFYLSGSWTAGLSVGADVGMGIGVWKSNVKGVAGKAHGGNVAGTFGPGIGVTFWFGYDGDFSGFQVNVVAGLSAELEYVRGVTEVF